MTHGFYAFIDESGYEGDPDAKGGCEFLILSAAVIRTGNQQFFSEVWERARLADRRNPRQPWPKFGSISSDSNKYLIAQILSDAPFRFATVIGHKPTLAALDQGERFGDLYFFLSQLLLERISWICRDGHSVVPSGNGRAKIIFSERKNLAYENFRRYADQLRRNAGRYHSNVDWNHVDVNDIVAREHHFCDGLRIADVIASAFGKAVEYKKHGITDDRYILPLARSVYDYNGRIIGNGLKIFPAEAHEVLSGEVRFRWLNSHYTKR